MSSSAADDLTQTGPSPGQHDVLEAEPAAASGPRAGDPAILGLISFVPGGVTLGLALTDYTTLNSGIDVYLFVTGLGLLVAAIWAAALGQSAVAAVFGLFAFFWISLGIQLTGLAHNWFGIAPEDTTTLQTYLIAFIVAFGMLTVTTLRLPTAFTAIFALVVVALALVLAGVANANTTMLNIAGYVVFAFTAVVIYVLAGAMSLATGGPAMNLGKPIQR